MTEGGFSEAAKGGGSSCRRLHRMPALSLSLLASALEGTCGGGALPIGVVPCAPLRLARSSDDEGTGELILERPRACSLLRKSLDGTGGGESASWWATLLTPFLLPTSAADGRRPALINDGHGRFLLVFSSLLTRMRADADSGGGAGFSFLKSLFHSRVSGLAPQGGNRSSGLSCILPEHEARSCRRFLLTLQRLSRDGGVTVPASDGGISHDGDEDWLAFLTRAARQELGRRGDYFPLFPEAGGVVGGETRRLIEGLVHHVLATEVEGTALQTLRELLVTYLFYDVGTGTGKEGAGEAAAAPAAPLMWSTLRRRLSRLHHRPHEVLQCAPPSLCAWGLGRGGSPSAFVSAVRRAAPPPCEGAVSSSQVLPGNVVVLALEGNDDDAFSGGGSVTGEPLWWEAPAAPSASTSPAALRVLLLRIDPAGDWMPPEEDSFNTQTFFSYYENDLKEQHVRRDGHAHRGSGKEDEEDEEVFEAMSHRMAGTREVLPFSTRDPITSDDEDCEDEHIINRLVASPSGAAAAGGGGAVGRDLLLLRSAIRLFLLVARNAIDIVLTPEKAPRLLHSVGRQYMPVLRALTQSLAPEVEAVHHAATVRVVDCVRLQDFLTLQVRTGTTSPRQPLLLCRGTLRLPASLRSVNEVDGPVLTALRVVCSPTNLLLRQPLADLVGGASVERGLPPGSRHRGLRSLGSRRACLVLALPQSPRSLAEPTVLLATPNAILSERYTHLLLKCAAAAESTVGAGVSGGVVRAGGAAFIVASGVLQRLARRMRQAASGGDGATAGARAEAGMTSAVLALLSEACLAVPNALADGVASLDPPATLPWARDTRGPRARRRLWGRALLQAASPTESNSLSHALHVYMPSVEELARHSLLQTGAATTSGHHTASQVRVVPDKIIKEGEVLDSDVYDTALRVFASDLGREPAGQPLPFVESMENELALLRVVMQALYMSFAAAAAAGTAAEV